MLNFRRISLRSHIWEGSLTPEVVEYLGASGVRTIHSYNYKELLNDPRILDAAQKSGVMFEVTVGIRKNEEAKVIEGLKHHPAVLLIVPPQNLVFCSISQK